MYLFLETIANVIELIKINSNSQIFFNLKGKNKSWSDVLTLYIFLSKFLSQKQFAGTSSKAFEYFVLLVVCSEAPIPITLVFSASNIALWKVSWSIFPRLPFLSRLVRILKQCYLSFKLISKSVIVWQAY